MLFVLVTLAQYLVGINRYFKKKLSYSSIWRVMKNRKVVLHICFRLLSYCGIEKLKEEFEQCVTTLSQITYISLSCILLFTSAGPDYYVPVLCLSTA